MLQLQMTKIKVQIQNYFGLLLNAKKSRKKSKLKMHKKVETGNLNLSISIQCDLYRGYYDYISDDDKLIIIISMFLSKKNAEYLNKPAKGKKIEARVLPGWGDDEETEQQDQFKPEYKNNNYQTKNVENLLGEEGDQTGFSVQNQARKQSKQIVNKKILYNWDELNEMNNIECEKRLVEGIVEPVGVKVKPTENQLVQFAKQSRSMDPAIIGSLLLSKLEVNYPFLVKAKSLYTIEHLVKKNQAFLSYFKSQNQLIRGFPQPQDNVQNYRKILKNVLNIIGIQTQKNNQTSESQGISFVDPGYNDPKQQSQIRGFISNSQKQKKPVGPVGPGSKKFISPTDAKKSMQGPTQKKNDVFDLFSDEKHQPTTQANQGFDDLILVGQIPKPNQPNQNITFDDLLKGSQPHNRANNLI